jgi:antitoxin VapB
MKTAKLFQNGQSQAIRLPKEFRFDGNEVFIKKMGRAVVLVPMDNPWEAFFNSLSKFSDDYMTSRNQPEQQNRKDLFK